MKTYIYSTIILLLIGVQGFGQNPTWSVNENDYEYTMSFVAFLNIDGNNLESSNDKVGAFVNGICRGVTNLTYVETEGRYYAYLTVFSNENNESINFEIYDSSNDRVITVNKTHNFEIDEHYGDVFQAYSIASPPLNDEAEIINFDFENIVAKDKIFDNDQITLLIDSSEDVTALNPLFQLSSGAKLYIGTIEQTSGVNTIDFSSPVEFKVLSEDQSILKDWTITVRLSSGDVTYYKKDAVCYEGGAIKIVSTQNNEEVELIKDGVVFSKQTIVNGETIFNNLEIANYEVKIGNIIKEIVINQKN
ncbi:hypothetical protein [uncultured Aquimarina sp.]|uniref:hypothetical protein n=1 Tax=uncultured Aquimarina sp. TaxID=575652 RepID=UPI002624CB27|nr:hypothetical protein [uncultured Aquimarina sp.]